MDWAARCHPAAENWADQEGDGAAEGHFSSSHSLLSSPPFKIETLKAFVFIHLLFCRLHLTSLPFLDSKLECCFILRQWWTLSQQEWMFYPEFCLHIPSCQSSSLAHSILECCSNSRQWRTQTGKRQCSRSRSRRNYSKSGARRMSPWSTMKFCRYIFFFWSSHHILNLCMFAKNYVFLGSRKQQGRHWEIQAGTAGKGQRSSLFGQVSFLPDLISDHTDPNSTLMYFTPDLTWHDPWPWPQFWSGSSSWTWPRPCPTTPSSTSLASRVSWALSSTRSLATARDKFHFGWHSVSSRSKRIINFVPLW